MGDVVEVLGVGGDWLEQAPGGFDGGPVLFLLVLAAAFGNQTVLPPDAVRGSRRGRQVELAPQALRAEGGQVAAEFPDALFPFPRNFVWTGVRRAGEGLKSLQARGLVAPQPLPHGRHGGLKEARRRLDPVLAGVAG